MRGVQTQRDNSMLDEEPKMVKVYDSELREMWTLLTELGGFVKITDDEFEYQTLDQVIEQRGQIVKTLTFEIDVPALSFKIGQGKTELHYGGHLEAISTFTQLQALLKSSRRPVLNSLFNVYTASGAIALLVLLIIISRPVSLVGSLAIVLSVFAIVILSGVNHNGGFSRILFMNRHEASSFWQRNKEDLLRDIISHTLTFLLGMLATYLLFKFGIK